MRILLVEDNRELAAWLTRALDAEGFSTDWLDDGALADRALADGHYALAILDLSLPRMDGLEILRRLRARRQALPVLILTARGEVGDRVAGLNLGADDYLAKPLALDELLARVKALLRRSQGYEAPALTAGPLVFDSVSRTFTLAAAPLAVTPREAAVLEVLMTRRGRAVTRESLFEQVFRLDDEANPQAIEIYVHRLRRKLDGSGVVITTLRGLGYLLEVSSEHPA